MAGFVLELSMPLESSDRIKFLNRIHLFHGLEEDQLQAVAEELEEETYPVDQEIIQQGELGDRLYLIWHGKVSVTEEGRSSHWLPSLLVTILERSQS